MARKRNTTPTATPTDLERLDVLGKKLHRTGKLAQLRLIELQLEDGRIKRDTDRKEIIRRELELSKEQARTKKDRERIQRALDRLNGEASAICRNTLI